MEDQNFFSSIFCMNNILYTTLLSFGSRICNQAARIRVKQTRLRSIKFTILTFPAGLKTRLLYIETLNFCPIYRSASRPGAHGLLFNLVAVLSALVAGRGGGVLTSGEHEKCETQIRLRINHF
jgi:hypothetical protein